MSIKVYFSPAVFNDELKKAVFLRNSPILSNKFFIL
ncbi:hypothetical protein SAMN05421846_10829 [Chryseobacterium taeanense]|uniref:Uncharacterized protein n=1 Tax=Chryseobacterium taeanense TaxID=311334 RepID=A0A1G8KRQ9_9FLAO|nr:hypothetical protein SAMN05421846_10829 [Chryseobacterium taeanense]